MTLITEITNRGAGADGRGRPRVWSFHGVERIHGVSHDGRRGGPPPEPSWSPSIGDRRDHSQPRTRCDAGTAFDGTHLYQVAEARIDKIDPSTGALLRSIPAPGHGRLGPHLGRGPLGWAAATARSSRSIPPPARPRAPSRPTGSSPG